MLIKPTIEEAEKNIDFAYELALDPTRSGYPTYTDGIKPKEDFVDTCRRGLVRDDREVLLYLEEGEVAGWILFLVEDGYLETNMFNIAGSIPQALAEFTDYCTRNFPGSKVCMGFPGNNKAAINYLSQNGWSCDEHSYNNVLFFDDYQLCSEEGHVVKVTRENYADFRKLHEAVQADMYWNADRLYDAMDEWDIYLYYEDDEPTAAIYCRDCEILMEIYGVDFKNECYQKTAFRTLVTKVLNECKRNGKKNMCFFGEAENQTDILELGFRCIGEYVLFVKKV